MRVDPHHDGEQDGRHEAGDQHQHQPEQATLAQAAGRHEVAVVDGAAVHQRGQPGQQTLAQLNVRVDRPKLGR